MSWLRNHRMILLLALVLTVGLLVSACAPEEEEPVEAEEPDDPEDEPEEEDDPVDEEDPEEKVLRIGMMTTMDTLDPHATSGLGPGQIMYYMYDTLLVTDYDLETIHPHVAQEWEVSEDGLLYTFHLREDVKFHSGRPLTAEDVVWSFERWLSEETASPTADRAGRVSEVRAPDDYTVEMELEAPHAMLPHFLAQPESVILDREVVEEYGEDYGSAMAGGSGPYKFVEWIPRERVELKRNPDYTWGPPIFDNSGPAHLDRIEYRKIPEASTLIMELEEGGIDVIYGTPPSYVQRVKDHPNINVVQTDPYLYMNYIGFKVVRPFADDIVIRKALNYAVDKQGIVDGVKYGVHEPLMGMMSSGVPDYWEGAEDIWPSYDPDEANRILDEAGYAMEDDGYRRKDGELIELEFIHFETPPQPEVAMYVQSYAQEVGIHIAVHTMPTGTFWSYSREDQYEMYSINTPVVSILETAGRYFHSRGMPSPNRWSWDCPETDDIIDQGRAAPTIEEALPYAKELQRIVAENYLMIPLTDRNSFLAKRDVVEGIRPHGQYGCILTWGILDADVNR